jgi:hypothetical protein
LWEVTLKKRIISKLERYERSLDTDFEPLFGEPVRKFKYLGTQKKYKELDWKFWAGCILLVIIILLLVARWMHISTI